MTGLLLSIYVLGFIITCGVGGALWGWDHPGAVFAALLWPLIIPVLIVQHHARRYLTRRAEREQLLREIEEEL